MEKIIKEIEAEIEKLKNKPISEFDVGRRFAYKHCLYLLKDYNIIRNNENKC